MAAPSSESDERVTNEMIVVGSVTIIKSPRGDLAIWMYGTSAPLRVQHADIDDLEKALALARKELPQRDG